MSKIFLLRLIPDNTNLKFMQKKWLGFSFSLFLILASICSLLIKGVNFGTDFTGGILMEVNIPADFEIIKLREKLSNMELGDVALQNAGSKHDVLIRIGANKKQEQSVIIEKVKTIIAQDFSSDAVYKKIDFVGPQVGRELIKNGFLSVIFSFMAIMCYIWVRFDWQYGVGLLIALMHDALLSLGFISLFGLEFNLASIAAILTVIGYSVNDSVVIYDRIRENLRKVSKPIFDEVINKSINETLSRTILTVLTTLLSALSLILFGGEAIKSFSLTVFFGIVIGTFSSIYISAPVLSYFAKK